MQKWKTFPSLSLYFQDRNLQSSFCSLVDFGLPFLPCASQSCHFCTQCCYSYILLKETKRFVHKNSFMENLPVQSCPIFYHTTLRTLTPALSMFFFCFFKGAKKGFQQHAVWRERERERERGGGEGERHRLRETIDDVFVVARKIKCSCASFFFFLLKREMAHIVTLLRFYFEHCIAIRIPRGAVESVTISDWSVGGSNAVKDVFLRCFFLWRRSGQSVTASDFGSNGPRFESGRGRCVESLDKALYSHCPKEKPSH